MSKTFRIIEARCPDTNTLEKRKIYTSKTQYKKRGKKTIDDLSKMYNVTVTTFTACKETKLVIFKIKNE